MMAKRRTTRRTVTRETEWTSSPDASDELTPPGPEQPLPPPDVELPPVDLPPPAGDPALCPIDGETMEAGEADIGRTDMGQPEELSNFVSAWVCPTHEGEFVAPPPPELQQWAEEDAAKNASQE